MCCMRVHACVCMHACMCAWTHVCVLHVFCAFVHASMHRSVHVCVLRACARAACMCACMHARVCVCMYVQHLRVCVHDIRYVDGRQGESKLCVYVSIFMLCNVLFCFWTGVYAFMHVFVNLTMRHVCPSVYLCNGKALICIIDCRINPCRFSDHANNRNIKW